MTFQVTDILSLIEGPHVVGDQWRTIRPFTRLRQAGINARWASRDDAQGLPTDPESTVLVAPRMSGDDEAAVDRWLAERRQKVRVIVYEMDDVLWGESMVEHLEQASFMQGKTSEQLLRDGEVSRYFASQCDGVIASSEALAELMRRDTSRPVICVPNAIDVRWFRAQMAYRAPWADYLTIGWSGGRRPERDVVPMAQAWGRVARRYSDIRFVCAAPVIPDVIYREVENDRQVVRLPWVSWEDCPVIYQTDIGCCAVADTEFSRAKTPIKAMEFGTAGAAVVATPTLYGPLIEDGKTGLLAETVDDWESALVTLVEDTRRRYSLNTALTDRIEREFSLDTQLHRWPNTYQRIVESMSGTAAARATNGRLMHLADHEPRLHRPPRGEARPL